MRFTLLHRALVLTAVLSGLTLFGPAGAGDDKDFKPLFNGKDFTGWKAVLEGKEADPSKAFSIKEEVIITPGKPPGYLLTDKNYKNYILRFDWKYARPKDLKDDADFKGNSGVLVHIQGLPAKGNWPKSVEVQGMNKEHAKIFAIGGAKGNYKFDAEALAKARKPVGEWNTTEIISQDGMLTSKVNGKEIASGKGELTEGPIGWQSEGAEIHFKNIKIKETK